MEAYTELGATRLSAIIYELKRFGFNISSVTKTVETRYGKTNIDALEEAKKRLEQVNANIAGVILNSIPNKGSKYGYYNNYYYYSK